MGAANSKQNQKSENSKSKENYSEDPETKDMKIENVLDYIATKYITQADFTELQNLHKAEYCDKLVILTSKVIKQFLSDKEKVLYLAKSHMDRLDIKNSIRKKRMCIGIVK